MAYVSKSSKTELGDVPCDENDLLKSTIIELCQRYPLTGISNETIQNALPSKTTQEIVCAINMLLVQRRINICMSGKLLIYKLRDNCESDTVIPMFSDNNGERVLRMVYQLIEKAGNKGISARKICTKTNMKYARVTYVLKKLVGKQSVKAVTSVSSGREKVYLLFHLKPDISVTGGTWYNEQGEFDHEFVDLISKQCLRYLQETAQTALKYLTDPVARRDASFVSSLQIYYFIENSRISKVSMSVNDIETIVDFLIYDGKVERIFMDSGGYEIKLYRSVSSLTESSPLMSVPCGDCPQANECSEGGMISPANCLLMKKWLEY